MILRAILVFYLIGVIMFFIVGFEGISQHITWKGLKATAIMSLFSWIGLWYVMLGGGSRNNLF
jgi:hypothetical protein